MAGTETRTGSAGIVAVKVAIKGVDEFRSEQGSDAEWTTEVTSGWAWVGDVPMNGECATSVRLLIMFILVPSVSPASFESTKPTTESASVFLAPGVSTVMVVDVAESRIEPKGSTLMAFELAVSVLVTGSVVGKTPSAASVIG